VSHSFGVELVTVFVISPDPPGEGRGGEVGEVLLSRLSRSSLSRPDALMPSTFPGRARCAELFPPGARHLVTLGNVADRYTHPDDQPDPPETSQ